MSVSVDGTEVDVKEIWSGSTLCLWTSEYAIWEFALLRPEERDADCYKIRFGTDWETYEFFDDSGVPLDADREEVEEFMQEAWDTFLTTYLAEVERNYNIQNARIVCEDGVWAVIGDE